MSRSRAGRLAAKGVVGAEGLRGEPDPFMRASRAAVRAILEELSNELFPEGISAAEVTTDARQVPDSEECSKTVVRALKDPASPDGGPRIHRV